MKSCLSLGKKTTSCFTILQTYCKLLILGTFSMIGYTYLNCYYQIVKNYVFICRQKSTLSSSFGIPKVKFIIHFFLEILHFKEPCNWNSAIFKPWILPDWWWNISNNISFHLRLFLEKTDDNVSEKIQETLFWGLFMVVFSKFEQKWFFWKKSSNSFYIFQLSTIMQKIKKTNEPSLRKMPNWRTDRQTGR